MSEPKMPWACVATDPATGNRIYQRTIEFEHTGNNEGTMTDAIEVRSDGGAVLAATEMSLDWEYHCTIDAAFADGGGTVVITGRVGVDEEVRRLAVPGAGPQPK